MDGNSGIGLAQTANHSVHIFGDGPLLLFGTAFSDHLGLAAPMRSGRQHRFVRIETFIPESAPSVTIEAPTGSFVWPFHRPIRDCEVSFGLAQRSPMRDTSAHSPLAFALPALYLLLVYWNPSTPSICST